MAPSPPVVRTVKDLRAAVVRWREDGLSVALVPTMGALHEGHLSLVDLARARADRVLASLFVNPTQFGPDEDFRRYPRDEGQDLAKFAARGVDLVFAPDVGEMYPQGFATTVTVEGLSECLCGHSRPGHFDGVATVVTKLLNQARADAAVFGEKDYQQLLIIRRLARDLDIATEILGGPIVREDDGLALSSRNAYLSEQERQMAPHLFATISAVAAEIAGGETVETALAQGRRVLAHAGFEVDYLEVRDGETLAPVSGAPGADTPARVFAAVFLGNTRLIDNVAISTP